MMKVGNGVNVQTLFMVQTNLHNYIKKVHYGKHLHTMLAGYIFFFLGGGEGAVEWGLGSRPPLENHTIIGPSAKWH